MAFENVNVSSLKNAITSCKNAINYGATLELTNSISSDLVWKAGAKDKLKESISKLANTRFKDLESKLNTYSEVASLIEQYKELEEENKSLSNQINSIKPSLYYTESYEEGYRDQNGNIVMETKYRTVKNYSIEQQIYNMQNKITANEHKMTELKTNVGMLL